MTELDLMEIECVSGAYSWRELGRDAHRFVNWLMEDTSGDVTGGPD